MLPQYIPYFVPVYTIWHPRNGWCGYYMWKRRARVCRTDDPKQRALRCVENVVAGGMGERSD